MANSKHREIQGYVRSYQEFSASIWTCFRLILKVEVSIGLVAFRVFVKRASHTQCWYHEELRRSCQRIFRFLSCLAALFNPLYYEKVLVYSFGQFKQEQTILAPANFLPTSVHCVV